MSGETTWYGVNDTLRTDHPHPDVGVSLNYIDDDYPLHHPHKHGRGKQMRTVFAVIGAFGCPVNLLVIGVVLGSARMRNKPFNILIVHQAFIDFMVSYMCMDTNV